MAAKQRFDRRESDSPRYARDNLTEPLLFGAVNLVYLGVMVQFILTIFWGVPAPHKEDAEWARPAHQEIRQEIREQQPGRQVEAVKTSSWIV